MSIGLTIVIVIFTAAIAWASWHEGYESRKVDEEEEKMDYDRI